MLEKRGDWGMGIGEVKNMGGRNKGRWMDREKFKENVTHTFFNFYFVVNSMREREREREKRGSVKMLKKKGGIYEIDGAKFNENRTKLSNRNFLHVGPDIYV